MKEILFFDSTLRDGSHAIQHQLTKENISEYCASVNGAGLHTVIVGHGNGLGASSLQVGLSKLTDEEMLSTARRYLQSTKLGAFLTPGFGTIKDDLIPAINCGVDLFCVACHCTEADITRQHIEYLKGQNKETYGVLMMYHRASLSTILGEAKKMQDYGANGVILMDSAGASTPELVKSTISTLVDNLNVRVGFHPHNNLGLAVSNGYIAIKEGATIIDGTSCGFGAGAGNLQLEAFVALLQNEGIENIPDLYKLLDVGDNVTRKIMKRDKSISSLSIVSGLAGVFSSFTIHVQKAAATFGIDPRDIFVELGRLKVVGGQEDVIIEVAEKLSKNKQNNNLMFQLESLS